MTDAQIDAGRRAVAARCPGSSSSSRSFVPACSLSVIVAGVFWMACQAFGWELRFRQSFGVTVHAFLPGDRAVDRPARDALEPADDRSPDAWGTSCRPTRASWSAPRAAKVLHSLLSSLDLMSFWTMGLLVLGLSAATGAPRGRMAVLVFRPLGHLCPRKDGDCGDLLRTRAAGGVETPDGGKSYYPPGRALTHADRHPGHHEGLRDGRGEGPRPLRASRSASSGASTSPSWARPAPESRR